MQVVELSIMKNTLLIIILYIFVTACQQKKEFNLTNDTKLVQLDSIQGKLMLDDRCGVDAPSIKLFNDSLYYYYPTEGSYYRIDKTQQDEISITYETVIKPITSSDKKTIFKIVNFTSNLYKLYIDNGYVGVFTDAKDIGKKYKVFHRNDCGDDELDIDTNQSINTTVSSNEIVGSWQLNCEIPNSGIEIYGKENDLRAYVQLLPPVIFLETKVVKGESEGIYYLKFDSQDMEAPGAVENVIEEQDIDKTKDVAKITTENGKINFLWYGLYDNKTKKLIHVSSQFGDKSAQLKKCKD